jgi:Fis family transcriptional regulator
MSHHDHNQQEREQRLSDAVHKALYAYFKQLNGYETTDLYDVVLREFERPLFSCVMEHYNGNQTRAAEILGISRVTLRKKLQLYDLL